MEAAVRYCANCGAATGMEAALVVAPKTSGAAVASLMFGLFFFFPFAPIIAVILGHIARGRIKRSNGAIQGDGLALAGLVLGYFFIACGLLALPMILHHRMD